jgi:hypothetical protein
LIDIKAHNATTSQLAQDKEIQMAIHDLEVVVFIVGAFALFGGMLGWASWDESRRARRNRK